MFANSRSIHSAQDGVHRQLPVLLARHQRHAFQKPIADYNRQAFEQSLAGWDGRAPLLLDAGCGVGLSSLHLAAAHPEHWVIGVDQSADRIGRGKDWPGPLPDNLIWVRANLVDYWRLLYAAGLRLDRHYLLYPNPWPKIGHLARRWHGHAVFPTLPLLGGVLECRSNWGVYIEELALAVRQVSGCSMTATPWQPTQPITPFERKYQASGQTLWRGVVDFRHPDLVGSIK